MGERRGKGKLEIRSQKSETGKRECGQARPGEQARASLGATSIYHVTTAVTPSQWVNQLVFEHRTRDARCRGYRDLAAGAGPTVEMASTSVFCLASNESAPVTWKCWPRYCSAATVAVKVLPAGTLTEEAAGRHFHKEALALVKLNLTLYRDEQDYVRWTVGSTTGEPATETCANIVNELYTMSQTVGTLVLLLSHWPSRPLHRNCFLSS